jgi:hypothetical protein
MSEVKVNKISPRSGTAITLGDSGDTFTIPSGATLAIAGSVTGFTSAGIDDNATSVAITINSSEQVGIGTTSPDHLLHISASSSNAQLKLQRTGSATASYNISASSDALAFSDQVAGSERMRITSTGLGIGTSSPDGKLQLVPTAVDTSIFSIRRQDSSSINLFEFFQDSNMSGGAGGAHLTTNNRPFAISTDSNSTLGTGLVIDITGKVGIGTSAPDGKFHVMRSDAGATANSASVITAENQGNCYVSLLGLNSDNCTIFFGDQNNNNAGQLDYDHANDSMSFYTNQSERMRIDSSGNVGISNTTPGDFNSQARNLVIGGGSGDTGMTIYSGSGSGDTGNIFFADGTSGSDQVRGGITYNHGDNSMNFRTNDGANRIFIDSSGRVRIANTSSTGHGSIYNLIVGNESSGGDAGVLVVTPNNENAYFGFGDDGGVPGSINYNHGSNFLRTYVNGSEAMRIDSSGRAMIGTTTADGILAVSDTNNETYLVVQNAKSGGSGEAVLSLKNDVGNYQVKCFTDDSFRIRDNTNSTDRLMISSGGTVFVSNTSEPSAGDNGAQISNSSYHIFCRNTSGAAVFRTFGSSGEFRTLGNGNAQNTNNSYGAISDRELKENEVDANSQWNDIKSLQIKHYNFKSKPNEKQLGVIAQDLEASGMNGLVENNQDELYTEDDVLPEGKNIGDVKLKNYKSVKYSILYMKSVKALQEAMERIETLEAKVTALETTTP